MGKGSAKARWLALYTGLYLSVIAALGAIMLRYGRTLVWSPDGLKQHYTVIGYVGRTVRDLFAGRGVPMLSFSLGQGLDVLTTCTYYGYTDPLSLIGALASGGSIEAAYVAIALLRAYLAGLCFGLYARGVGVRDGWAAACSAAVYVFSGYFLWMIGRHPYFLNGALYLPLMLLGVERILKDRRWLAFTLVSALMLVVNFYFAYMNTVIAIAYIIVRLIARLRDRGVRESARDGFMLLGSYLLGAALSAAVFLPVATVYLSNSRLGVRAGYSGSMLRYGAQWYRDVLFYAFTPWKTPGHYVSMNYAPLAVFGLLALFGVKSSRARQARIGLYLCALAVCVPMAGLLLNGMAYVSNRWSYAMNFFAALGCAVGLAGLFKMKRSGQLAVGLAGLAAAAILAAACAYRREWQQLAAPVMIALFAALLLAYAGGRVQWLNRRRVRSLAAGLLAVSCAIYMAAGYLPRGYGYILEQEESGIYDRVAGHIAGPLIEDGGAYRVSQGYGEDAHAPLLNYMGTSFFWSLVDGGISDYYRGLWLPGQHSTYDVRSLGGGSAINAVAGVKYFVRAEGEDYVVPYGFEASRTLALPDGSTAEIYENTCALPLGYAYDAHMTRQDYDAMPVEDRLAALTRFAVVERADGLPTEAASDFSSGAAEVPYEIARQTDAEWTGHILRGSAGGRIRLDFDAPEDCELYLMLEGIHIEDVENMSNSELRVVSEQGAARGEVLHPESNFYFPKDNFAFCIGSGDVRSCEIVLSSARVYSCDAIRVVAVPLAGYRESAAARQAEGMTDVELSNDRVFGRISVAGERVLQVAVPYSSGWTAWVDGVKQPVFRCGGMYMGIAMDAGTHAVELRYETPGLRTGLAVSGAAAVLTAILAVLGARRRRRARR